MKTLRQYIIYIAVPAESQVQQYVLINKWNAASASSAALLQLKWAFFFSFFFVPFDFGCM